MKNTKTITLGALLALVMVVTVGSPYLNNPQAVAQEVPVKENVISVTGMATASVKPDLLVVTFGMETQEKTAKEALDANSNAMNRVVDAIKTAGITDDEISTSNFSIYPVYDGYEDPITKRWTQELRGYRVTNTITVETTSLNLAAAIIDGAVTAGANRVDNVYFTLSPETQMTLKDSMIEKAVQNAQEKAEKALAPLNHSIVGVKAVSLSDFGMPPPMPMYDMEFAQGMALKSVSTPIFSSEQDISTSANVVFLIGSN